MKILQLCAGTPAIAATVAISNILPRRDTDGNIMDAHDSKIIHHEGLYHWFAASYGSCVEPKSPRTGCAGGGVGSCGFRTDHNVTLYTSPDLVTWKRQGVVFGAAANLPPQSVLFNPKAVYNPATQQWVLWFNYIVDGSFGRSYYACATSRTASGPFALSNRNVTSLQYSINGDQNLFVDEDGQGYIIYTNIGTWHHRISIERLTSNFTESLGHMASSGIFGEAYVEAPMMFRRGEVYYAAFGRCCCYCEAGSVVTYYTATSPLGPYTKRASLGQLHSQSTDIFPFWKASGEAGYMYLGNHWQSAPDRIMGHDYTVWAPLLFGKDGNITTAGFVDSFEVSVLAGSRPPGALPLGFG